MFLRKLPGLLGAALALALVAQPALAQEGGQTTSERASGIITGERVLPGRIGGDQQDRRDRRQPRERRQAQPAPPTPATPEELKVQAQEQATAAGLTCQVTEAINPGVNAEQQKVYEAACASDNGYILIASTPPQAFNCLELAGTAATARRADPNADVGQQCTLPANQNGLAVIGGWARAAGASCTIDEAIAIGKSDDNNVVYEVGCAGADGYWLEKTPAGWDLKDCLQIASTGGSCRFTTAQEQADGFESKLTGTEASGCDVTQVRLMGSNANGRFYEAKCAAEGTGYIARVSPQGQTQQIYPCATAQRIGGGCQLTQVAAAAPATEQ